MSDAIEFICHACGSATMDARRSVARAIDPVSALVEE